MEEVFTCRTLVVCFEATCFCVTSVCKAHGGSSHYKENVRDNWGFNPGFPSLHKWFCSRRGSPWCYFGMPHAQPVLVPVRSVPLDCNVLIHRLLTPQFCKKRKGMRGSCNNWIPRTLELRMVLSCSNSVLFIATNNIKANSSRLCGRKKNQTAKPDWGINVSYLILVQDMKVFFNVFFCLVQSMFDTTETAAVRINWRKTI